MNNDFKARMARYEQELLHLRQRSHLPEIGTPEPSQVTQDEPPAPVEPLSTTPHNLAHFQGNITQEKNSGEYPDSAQPTPPIPLPRPTASMRVSVVNAHDDSPIADAIVAVDRRIAEGREPMHVRFTDQHGNTPLLSIPLSTAEALYDIRVTAANHYHEILSGLTANTVGGNHRILLKPLPEH